MKILVAVKQVPARESPLRVAPGGTWIDETGLDFEINEPDAYALEEALQLRDQAGGEVVALTVGPERALSTLREALAKGADRAIHVSLDDPQHWDSLNTARLIAAAARGEGADLILTGLQSDDTGAGQTGVLVAELTGAPHATIVMQVEFVHGAPGGGVRVKRELENGFFQYVTMPMPAVLTIQSGIKKLRYATLMGIKKAKTKEVKTVTPQSLGVENTPSYQVLAVTAPSRQKSTVMIEGGAAAAAAQLVERLRNEARVL
jgi:electron transfer flavoprotein beta subunit